MVARPGPELETPGTGAVNDLALGIDGRNLYAATEQGVWQLGLVS